METVYRQRTETPKKVVIVIPAKADGEHYDTNILIRKDGTEEWQLDLSEIPRYAESTAVVVTVLPDGKLISDAAERATNERAAELLNRFGLTPADVEIKYESNHSYINLLWWQAINRCWLAHMKEQAEQNEKLKPKKRSSGKKGGTP